MSILNLQLQGRTSYIMEVALKGFVLVSGKAGTDKIVRIYLNPLQPLNVYMFESIILVVFGNISKYLRS